MQLGIVKGIVSRILSTLESQGYVIRDQASDSFRIGLRFAGIALRHIDELGVSDLCVPLLRAVSERTGELVQLCAVQGDQIFYVAKAEGQQRIRVLSLVGRAAVLHASSAGKVWLASLPDEQALALVLKQGLTRFTPQTITELDQFRAELMRVRKSGYALVKEELVEGGNAVGVPIHGRTGDRVVGAVVLSGPAYRLPTKRMLSLVPIIQELATKLGDLGSINLYFPGVVLDPQSSPVPERKLA